MRYIVIFLSILLSGCVVVKPNFYQYEGSPLAADKESVLYIEDGDNIFIKDLDGVELASPYTTWNGGYSAIRAIHVLPGVHTVYGMVSKGGVYNWYKIKYNFVAGKRYRLSAKLTGYQMSADIAVVANK